MCDFLAERSCVPSFSAVTVLGAADRKAGAFIVIRRMLHEAGCDVSELRPSTLLECYSGIGLPKVWKPLQLLMPAHMARVIGPGGVVYGLLLILAALSLFAAPFLAMLWFNGVSHVAPWLVLALLLSAGALWALWWREQHGPSFVRWPELRTFRDLAAAIAHERPPSGGLKCGQCGYPLIGLVVWRCPECGNAFSPGEFGLTQQAFARAVRPPADGRADRA